MNGRYGRHAFLSISTHCAIRLYIAIGTKFVCRLLAQGTVVHMRPVYHAQDTHIFVCEPLA